MTSNGFFLLSGRTLESGDGRFLVDHQERRLTDALAQTRIKLDRFVRKVAVAAEQDRDIAAISARFLRQQSPRLSRKAIIQSGIGSRVPLLQVPCTEEVAPRLIGEALRGIQITQEGV
jgi:hypothetical protein